MLRCWSSLRWWLECITWVFSAILLGESTCNTWPNPKQGKNQSNTLRTPATTGGRSSTCIPLYTYLPHPHPLHQPHEQLYYRTLVPPHPLYPPLYCQVRITVPPDRFLNNNQHTQMITSTHTHVCIHTHRTHVLYNNINTHMYIHTQHHQHKYPHTQVY